jgi:hypothetical protein
MDTVRTLSLILATLTMGLVTGAFVVFWHTIMPGLATTDDRRSSARSSRSTRRSSTRGS